jgi:hypothetical protein
LDEAVTFVFIEEFHCADGHVFSLCGGGSKARDRFWLEVRERRKKEPQSALKPSICD